MAKHLIYISGPITDNKTGLPREGWQDGFRAAKEKLRGMGFEVITPVEIAESANGEWNTARLLYGLPEQVPRWFYISECMTMLAILMRKDGKGPWITVDGISEMHFAGLYVIGELEDISVSYGTMCEINFAMAAGLPVWSQYFNDYQINNMLWQQDGITLAEAADKLVEEGPKD